MKEDDVMKNQEFIPVLLGSDRNVYGMAVAFYEEYGVKSIALGKTDYSETAYSKILELRKNINIEDEKVFLMELTKIHNDYKKNKLLLIACSDIYMKLVIKNKEKLKDHYIIPYIDEKLMNKLVLKENFYKTCEEYNLDYPNTLICTCDNYKDLKMDFKYPIIIKPSNSVLYWKSKFEGKKKIFISNNEKETKDILSRIYGSTYNDHLIIQEYIKGDDTNLRVLNAYVDSNHKVTFMGLGQVILEEKNPGALGDYGAIITTYDKELFDKMQKFLEDIKYVGYANFDFKYDQRDKKYKLFEINIRQGRSSSFTTLSGKNITKYLVEDYIYNIHNKIEYLNNEFLWTIVPKGVILKYVKNKSVIKKVKQLYKEKKVGNILFYKKDFSFKRYIRVYKRVLSNYKKYKIYYK